MSPDHQVIGVEAGRERVAELVARRLLHLKVSPEDVAKRAGVGGNTVRRLAAGSTWPQQRSLRAISEALGWKPGLLEEVVTGAKEPEPYATSPPLYRANPSPAGENPLMVALVIDGVDWDEVSPLDRRVVETAMVQAGLEKWRELGAKPQ